ncbi:hypothetical protein [Roseomonas sp. USHLN139]|uniref:hypothetical protein n=1 Tax=Roseomonas sp. USHLN139 TaxID=3081298 RepID=UPI003B020E45
MTKPEDLRSPEARAAYLYDVRREGDPAAIAEAERIVAAAIQMYTLPPLPPGPLTSRETYILTVCGGETWRAPALLEQQAGITAGEIAALLERGLLERHEAWNGVRTATAGQAWADFQTR